MGEVQTGGDTTGNTAELPTPEEVYHSQNRRSLRERKQPERYGDWNGSSVNWVKEVLLTIGSSGDGHAVSDSVRAQILSDASNRADQLAAVELEKCEWVSLSVPVPVPQVLAATETAVKAVVGAPRTLKEAFERPDGEQWRTAADSEIDSQIKNHTFDLVKREDWMRVLPSKWVLTEKTDSEGVVVRHKARLVIGYRLGRDFCISLKGYHTEGTDQHGCTLQVDSQATGCQYCIPAWGDRS
jgi:hypothetical protein